MQFQRGEIFGWSALVLVTLFVYGTVGIARRVLDAVEQAGQGDALHLGVLVLLAALLAGAVVWLMITVRGRRILDFLLLGAISAAYGVVLLTLSEMPVERIHLLEYGLVGMLAHRALRYRFVGLERTLLAVLIALNVGLGDEIIQGLLPRRFYDTKDIVVNGVAGLLGVLAASLLARPKAAGNVGQTG